jgi:hypothetical protein
MLLGSSNGLSGYTVEAHFDEVLRVPELSQRLRGILGRGRRRGKAR